MVEALLSREQILQAEDLPSEVVEIPEWNGSVIVRGLTGSGRGKFQNSILSQNGNANSKNVMVDMKEAEMRLVAYCVVDENGKRLFTEKDIAELGKKAGSAINRISDVAMRLSGFTQEDLQELTENLTETQSGVSGSS
jgi:hypothetical protein